MNDLVSIIMPVYNGAKHLDFSIASVASQTFRDWELLIIDDGSTDESTKIIHAWMNKDCRIRTLHQPNKGVSSARNLGITHCRGNYITMMDADDALIPEALELLIREIQQDDNIDLVTCGFSEITPSISQVVHRGGLLMGRKENGRMPCDDGFLAEYAHCSIWGKLLKTQLIRQHNLQFKPGMKVGEDHLFFLQYLQHCRQAAVLQQELYHYMHWSDSAISKYEKGEHSLETYIDSILLFCTIARETNKKWAPALLSHFFRVSRWIKTIILSHRPADWPRIRQAIYKALPPLLYRAGIIGSLRMFRRWHCR